MSDSLDGPGSERWIEPFGNFLVGEQLLTKAQVQQAARLLDTLDTRVGWLAVAVGYMSARDVYAVLSAAQDRHALFGELAVELGVLSPRQVGDLLALQQSPFRLFLHCLLIGNEVDRCTLHDMVDQFVHQEGLVPAWDLGAAIALSPRRMGTGFGDTELWMRLDEVPTLATLPSVAPRLLALVERGEAPTDDLAATIAHDPALTAQLLRVAGSALRGQGTSFSSVRGAVETLGAPIVQQLVLTTTVLNAFDEKTLPRARALWEHSLRSALWCRALGERLELPDDAFLCGMLHELGRLVLLQVFPEECARIDALAASDATREQAERQVFGTTEADVGAYICRVWSLPEAVGQAALHHATPTVMLRQTPGLLPTTRAVHAACRLAETARHTGAPYLDAAFQSFHGLDLGYIADLAPGVEEEARALIARFID